MQGALVDLIAFIYIRRQKQMHISQKEQNSEIFSKNRLTKGDDSGIMGKLRNAAAHRALKKVEKKLKKLFENLLTKRLRCDILFRLRKSVARILIIDN